MSDRLKELQRQRALAQEQLAWLDQEIARETGAAKPKPMVPVTRVATNAPMVGGVPSSRVGPAANPDEILQQYQGKDTSIHSEVKRGCLIYFFAAFALLALGIAAFALFTRR